MIHVDPMIAFSLDVVIFPGIDVFVKKLNLPPWFVSFCRIIPVSVCSDLCKTMSGSGVGGDSGPCRKGRRLGESS